MYLMQALTVRIQGIAI